MVAAWDHIHSVAAGEGKVLNAAQVRSLSSNMDGCKWDYHYMIFRGGMQRGAHRTGDMHCLNVCLFESLAKSSPMLSAICLSNP